VIDEAGPGPAWGGEHAPAPASVGDEASGGAGGSGGVGSGVAVGMPMSTGNGFWLPAPPLAAPGGMGIGGWGVASSASSDDYAMAVHDSASDGGTQQPVGLDLLMQKWLIYEEPTLLLSREWQDFTATYDGQVVDPLMFPPQPHQAGQEGQQQQQQHQQQQHQQSQQPPPQPPPSQWRGQGRGRPFR
jgi:hypothetical protein